MQTITVTFDYEDFNTTTRRDADMRRHDSADVHRCAEGVYIYGNLGCGKTRVNVHEALIAYLGGRRLLAHRVFD